MKIRIGDVNKPKRAQNRLLQVCLVSLLLGIISGCMKPTSSSGGSGSPPFTGTYYYSSGNWQFQATPTVGSLQFAGLSGFVDEEGAGSGVNDFTTAALRVQSPGNCYGNATSIPFEGGIAGTQLSVNSFGVDAQFIALSATTTTMATRMSGTYSITGGCADGSKGTIVGTRYSPLNGVYAGSKFGSGANQSAVLTLVQTEGGTGDGTFPMSGTATLQGFSCFNSGYMSYGDSYVSGASVHLVFFTNDPTSAQIIFDGTFDVAASKITLTSINITGGSCAGPIGGATLSAQ